MPDASPSTHSAAPVLLCTQLAASIAHYRDVLGFEVALADPDQPIYAILRRGGAEVHLASPRTAAKAQLPGHGSCYVIVSGVDRLYAELRARGAKILTPPESKPYGLRDFYCQDLDGNVIAFGESLG